MSRPPHLPTPPGEAASVVVSRGSAPSRADMSRHAQLLPGCSLPTAPVRFPSAPTAQALRTGAEIVRVTVDGRRRIRLLGHSAFDGAATVFVTCDEGLLTLWLDEPPTLTRRRLRVGAKGRISLLRETEAEELAPGQAAVLAGPYDDGAIAIIPESRVAHIGLRPNPNQRLENET